MKKIAMLASSVAIGALMCASPSFADQSLTSHALGCVASLDYCAQVSPGSPDVHDAVIKVDAKAYNRHEAPTWDWQFWEDGSYGAGVKNAAKHLEYLYLTVLSANGKPVSGDCEIHAYKGQTGNYDIVLRKNNDGSISCVQHG